MNVIIPMSGTGSRFIDAGYKQIKPLIKIFNKTIIKYIVEKFSPSDNFIFICRKEHLENDKIQLEKYLITLAKNVKVLAVDNHKFGPVHSIIKVKKNIPLNEEVIVNYCDFDWRWNYQNFKNWVQVEKPQAALCVYSGFHPHYINPAPYAHVKCHQQNVLDIKEKESFTKYRSEEPAASGTFYFANGKLLLKACEWLVKNNIRVNNEFYVSLIFNYFPLYKYRCLIYKIDFFMQWGTPEDLEEYIFLAKKIPMNFKKQIVDTKIITFMTNHKTNNFFKNNEELLNSKIGNKYLYYLCNYNFNSKLKKSFTIVQNNEDKVVLQKQKIKSEIIIGKAKSNIENLMLSLDKICKNPNDSLFIMPHNRSVDFNWKNFLKFLKSKNKIDGVIFSFNNYPFFKWYPEKFNKIAVLEDNKIDEIIFNVKSDSTSSSEISTEYYWFPNKNKLKLYLKKYIKNNKTCKLSLIHFCNYLIQNNYLIFSYPVNDYLSLSSYFEYRSFEYWSNANSILPIR